MIIRKGNPVNISVHHTVPGSTGAKNKTELIARARAHDNYHKTKSVEWNNDTPGEFGYRYIRYHYLIARDGSFIQTQDEKYVLYSSSDGKNGPFNYWGIAIALEGNYEIEKPTDAQRETLAQLVANFEKKYKVNVTVRGHKEVAAKSAPTACPGKNIGTHDSGWLKGVIARANEILKGVPAPQPQPQPEPQPDYKVLYENTLEALRKLSDQMTAANSRIQELELASVSKATMEQLVAEIHRRVS